MTDQDKKFTMLQAYLKFVFDTQNETGMATNEQIFDWFYSEIEAREEQWNRKTVDMARKLIARDKEIKDLEASEDELCTKVRKEQDEAVRVYNQGEERDKIRLAEIQRLEEIINAADLMVYEIGSNGNMGYYEALEHYNKLKSKLPSGI